MYKSQFNRTLIWGFTISIFILFRLIILSRIPYCLNEYVNIIRISLIIILILVTMRKIINIIKIINNRTISINKFVKYLILHLYEKPLEKVCQYLLTNSMIKYLTNIFGQLYVKLFKTKFHVYLYVYSYLQFPMIILNIILLADVFILNEIRVFLFSMWLFLYPITYNSSLKMLYIHANNEMLSLEKESILVTLNNLEVTIQPKQNMEKFIFDHLVNEWLFYEKILYITNIINNYQKTKLYLTISLFSKILFLIGWIGALLHILISKWTSISIFDKKSFVSVLLWWLIGI